MDTPDDRIPNSVKHPEAWEFYVECARNIMAEDDIKHLGNYRISLPGMNGEFLYAWSPESLWYQFIVQWHKPCLDSPSVYGKIQYIVEHFNH